MLNAKFFTCDLRFTLQWFWKSVERACCSHNDQRHYSRTTSCQSICAGVTEQNQERTFQRGGAHVERNHQCCDEWKRFIGPCCAFACQRHHDEQWCGLAKKETTEAEYVSVYVMTQIALRCCRKLSPRCLYQLLSNITCAFVTAVVGVLRERSASRAVLWLDQKIRKS